MSQHERVLLVDSSGNPIITTPFKFDDTDKLAISAYGKKTVPGDTPFLLDTNGVVYTSIRAAGTTRALGIITAGADGEANDNDQAWTTGLEYLFNGTSWDRGRNNEEVTLLASAARTVSTTSSDQVNYNARGIVWLCNVTSVTDTPSVTLQVQLKDPVSGAYFRYCTLNTLTSVDVQMGILYPGAVETQALGDIEIQGLPLGRTWRLAAQHADSDSITYSVACSYIL